MYQIKIEKSALKQLKALPKYVVESFALKFKQLSIDPFIMPGVDTIKNPKSIGISEDVAYRIRVENYRAIYVIEHEIVTITIIEIAHRSEVYRKK